MAGRRDMQRSQSQANIPIYQLVSDLQNFSQEKDAEIEVLRDQLQQEADTIRKLHGKLEATTDELQRVAAERDALMKTLSQIGSLSMAAVQNKETVSSSYSMTNGTIPRTRSRSRSEHYNAFTNAHTTTDI